MTPTQTGRITLTSMSKRLLIALLVLVPVVVAVSAFIFHNGKFLVQAPPTDLGPGSKTSLAKSPITPAIPIQQKTEVATNDNHTENTFCSGAIYQSDFQINSTGVQKLLENTNLSGLAESDIKLLVAALNGINALFAESLDPLDEESKLPLPEPYRKKSLEALKKEANNGDSTASRLVGKHLSFAAFKKYGEQFEQTDESVDTPKSNFRLLSTDPGFVEGINYLNISCASGDNDSCFSAYFMSLMAERAVWRRLPQTGSKEWQHFRIQRFAYAELMIANGPLGMRYLIASDNAGALPENESGVYPNELSDEEKIAVQKQALDLAEKTQRTLEIRQIEEKERLDWLQRWGYLEKFSAEVEIMCP